MTLQAEVKRLAKEKRISVNGPRRHRVGIFSFYVVRAAGGLGAYRFDDEQTDKTRSLENLAEWLRSLPTPEAVR